MEVVCLGLLPMLHLRFGLRGTMLTGLAAWALAMGILALGRPVALVIGSLGLHGICICCFLVSGQVYLNSRARGGVRTSVQSIYTFISGMGLLGGNLAAGWVRSWAGGDFGATFATAALLTTALVLVFLVGFTGEAREDPPEEAGGRSRDI
jgi:hypothetical protein